MPSNSPRNSALLRMLVLAGTLLAAPIALAQEEAPEETGGRFGSFRLNVETWVAQPTGLGYSPAREKDPITGRPTQILEIGHGTESEIRWEGEYELPSDRGSFVLGVFKHTDAASLTRANESFVFEQPLSPELFAGVNNNGLADKFTSVASTKLREVYFEFHREAFRSPRLEVDWFVGWRRVEHSRRLSADYFALSPGLPPVLGDTCGDCPNLLPFEDSANLRSDFDGRGATVGVELAFSLWRKKLVFDSGLAVTVMRGKTNAAFTGQNAVYLLDCGEVGSTLSPTCTATDRSLIDTVIVLGPPYDAFDETFDINAVTTFVSDSIFQAVAAVGVQAQSVSTTSQVYDVHLGIRWRALKRFEPFAGFRQTHYSDVGINLRPELNLEDLNDVKFILKEGALRTQVQELNVTGLQQIDTSVTYEGFFFGVTIRMF